MVGVGVRVSSSQLASSEAWSEARDSGRSSERPPPPTILSPSTTVSAVEACSSGGGGGGAASVGFAQPRTGDLLGRAARPSRAAALACTRAGEGDLEARRWRLSAEWTISRFTSRARRPWDYD